MRGRKFLSLLLLAPSLAGCAILGADQLTATEQAALPLQAGGTVGQTFVARWNGLEGTELFLSPETPGDGEVRLHVRSDPQATTDLAFASLSIRAVTQPAFYRFVFQPQRDSWQRYYYMFLEVSGTGSIQVGRGSGDAYLDGSMYSQASPATDAQMSFRLVYLPWYAFWGAAYQAMQWTGMIGVSVLLFVLPGWALLALLWPRITPLASVEKLCLAISLSLSLYPVLMLWTDLARVHLGLFYAWLPVVGGLGALLWLGRTWRPVKLRATWEAWQHSNHLFPDLALLGVAGLVFLTRFWVIRSLDIPLWGDSYQHTMIAQLLVDNGGLFNSWQPYADLQTLTYHFGFHAVVAAFSWVTRLDLPSAVLWTGQILNGLAVLALYPLATRLGGNRWAGVAAVLIAGLISPMPMFYVNWGRYTQLAGQAILPGAILSTWTVLETQQRAGRLMALAWITLGGIALVHYRILLFFMPFPLVFFVLNVGGQWRALLFKTFWLAVGGSVLFLPWFIRILPGEIMWLFTYQLTTPPAETAALITTDNLSNYLPSVVWILLPLCLGWGLWRRKPDVALVSLWWFLLLLATNPEWLHLPGAGVISNFALLIAAYIPAGILIGAAAGWLVAAIPRGRRWEAVVMLLTLGLGLWSARLRLTDLQISNHELVTRPDVRAASWIQSNTPVEARFLVNSFFTYGGTLVVGSDGGWWLPLLAHRQTTLPPLLYAVEQGPRPDYREWINLLSAEIQQKGVEHADVIALLKERGVTHVYIGQRQGSVNNAGGLTLKPEELLASSHFGLLYHQDRIWVFAVCDVAPGCAQASKRPH